MSGARRIVLVLICLLAPAGADAGEMVTLDGVLHVQNPASPSGDTEVLTLKEQWRVGGDDEDVLLGIVRKAMPGKDGRLYLLDFQLSEVHVFSPAGEYLRSLSHEGDGPGEIRRPADMLFMPDGSLGLVQGFPGQIVMITLDDVPAGTLQPGGVGEGGFANVNSAAYRGGNLVLCGGRMSGLGGDEPPREMRYLASYDTDGNERVRYVTVERERDFSRFEYIERDHYFVNDGRWALGPDGKVYAAEERDRYAIRVYAPDGSIDRIIECDIPCAKRTAGEKEEVGAEVMIVINGEQQEMEREIEDHQPAILRMHVTSDGHLWVLSGHGDRDQPEGIMQTYDIFDAEGHYIKRVAIACEGDPEEDLLFACDDGRYVLVKGYTQAQEAMRAGFAAPGDEEAETGEAEPLEVICYGS